MDVQILFEYIKINVYYQNNNNNNNNNNIISLQNQCVPNV